MKKENFNFKCENPACQTEATMEDATNTLGKQFACPAQCGASYVLWKNPESKKIEAMNVVMPLYVAEDFETEEDFEDFDDFEPYEEEDDYEEEF